MYLFLVCVSCMCFLMVMSTSFCLDFRFRGAPQSSARLPALDDLGKSGLFPACFLNSALISSPASPVVDADAETRLWIPYSDLLGDLFQPHGLSCGDFGGVSSCGGVMWNVGVIVPGEDGALPAKLEALDVPALPLPPAFHQLAKRWLESPPLLYCGGSGKYSSNSSASGVF